MVSLMPMHSIMKITFISSYPKLIEGGDGKKTKKLDGNGNPVNVFKYRLTGTEAELAKYRKAMEDSKIPVTKDDKGYLWFSPVFVGETGLLKISTNGKVFADTSLMDVAQSLAEQHGKLGIEMAKDLLKNGFSKVREEDSPVEEPEKNIED